MDEHKLSALVMSRLNDGMAVRAYGHGFLVAMPLAYWDEDSVTLFVEPFEDGYRVTDQGSTALRLHMLGLNPATPRVSEAWARSVAALNLFNPGEEELELAHFTSAAELGGAVVKVAEASLRVDQLRWLHTNQKPVRFGDRVVKHLGAFIGDRADVRPNAPVRLRHGRERKVTAAVETQDDREILFVQAVGGTSNETRERAVEHCTFLFKQAEALDSSQCLAVASGHRDDWDPYFTNTLAEASEVAFFDEPGGLDAIVLRQLTNA